MRYCGLPDEAAGTSVEDVKVIVDVVGVDQVEMMIVDDVLESMLLQAEEECVDCGKKKKEKVLP